MEYFAYNTLKLEISTHGVAEVILNRPEVHNALNEELIEEFIAVLAKLEADPVVRILCLSGEGQSFCAGADITSVQKTIAYSQAENIADALKLGELLDKLYHFSKPTIALIHGAAYGGGIGLISCCDIALASINSHFCFAEAKLGLIPAMISPYVVAAIGPRHLRYLMLTAARFSAAQAETAGLLHEVLPSATQLITRKRVLVNEILANSSQALVAAKQLIHRVTAYKMDPTLHEELATLIAELRISEEAQKRMWAFIEKK